MQNSAEKKEEIHFDSDGFSLFGILHMPETKNPPLVIGSHGLLSDIDSPKQIELARELNACGIAYFRFSHRGSRGSEGELSESSIESRVKDLQAAFKMLSARKDLGRPFGLFGSSLGAASCLAAWSSIRPAACFIIAPPTKGRVLWQKSPEELKPLIESTKLSEAFFKENLDFDLTEKIPAIRNIFIVHGTDDKVVPVEEGHMTYELAAEPKRFIAFEGGDHQISHPGHQKVMMKRALEFFEEKLSLKARSCGF